MTGFRACYKFRECGELLCFHLWSIADNIELYSHERNISKTIYIFPISLKL